MRCTRASRPGPTIPVPGIVKGSAVLASAGKGHPMRRHEARRTLVATPPSHDRSRTARRGARPDEPAGPGGPRLLAAPACARRGPGRDLRRRAAEVARLRAGAVERLSDEPRRRARRGSGPCCSRSCSSPRPGRCCADAPFTKPDREHAPAPGGQRQRFRSGTSSRKPPRLAAPEPEPQREPVSACSPGAAEPRTTPSPAAGVAAGAGRRGAGVAVAVLAPAGWSPR